MLLVLINVLVIVVVGAILFYLIDRFVRDGRLGNLLKILVVLICLAAILQRLLPVLGVNFWGGRLSCPPRHVGRTTVLGFSLSHLTSLKLICPINTRLA